jgi:uncharacterized membrane protein
MSDFYKPLRAHFLRGLAILLPIVLTAYISYWIFLFLYRILDFGVAFLPPVYRQLSIVGGNLRLLVISGTIAGTIFIIWFTGFLVRTVIGRAVATWFQSILVSMPVVGAVYKGIKQLFKVFFSEQTPAFSKVVLVEFPQRGSWAYAFITDDAPDHLWPDPSQPCYTVLVPATPNPIHGFLMIVPKTDVVMQELTVEQGIKIIVSAGVLEK